MTMPPVRSLVTLISALALVVGACAPAAPGGTPPATPGAPAGTPAATPGELPADLEAVYVSTGPIGVNPFLQLIADGLHRGGEDCRVAVRVVESSDETAMADNLRATIDEGVDLIVTNSFQSVDAVTQLGQEFPDQLWAVVDVGIEENPNVRGIVFKEHEGMFLVGAIMGLLATGDNEGYPRSDQIGFVGAIDIPLIRRWFVGYQEGVQAVNPDASVLESWGTDFADPATSKELALAQADQGAEYIAAAAAAGNTGVFEAARERGFFTSGVDTDQRSIDPEHIIESMVKRTDVGVYEAVCDLAAGEFSGGFVAYGLAEEGVGPAFLVLDELDPPSRLPEEVEQRVRELAAQIVAGEIEVTDYLQQQN